MKLLVTDLDGTLLDAGKKVQPRDRKALQEAAANGIEICLASGRMDQELVQVMEEVGGVYHRISQNGAFVFTKDNRLLQSSTFEPKLAKQLLEAALPYDFVSLVCVDQTVYIPKKTEASEQVASRMFAPFVVEPDILRLLDQNLIPCKFSFFGDLDKLKKMQRELKEKFPGKMETFISDKDCLDLMPLGTSKGAGVRVLIKELGIHPEEVVCVGDAFNDLSMFEVTPYSFAMAHGPEEVRRSASQVVHSVAEAVAYAHIRGAS